MAESHSEDSPLLGTGDPPSPGECSPGPRGLAPSWPIGRFRAHEDSSSLSSGGAWAPSANRRPSSEERFRPADSPRVNTHKFVDSQTSMDSGCDCDPSDGDPPHPHYEAKELVRDTNPGGASERPAFAGPSGRVAPLAQRESLNECRCGALEQRCVCEATSPVGGEGTPLSHTDRGELPKVTFRIEGYDDEDEHLSQRLGPLLCANGEEETDSQTCSEPGDDFKAAVERAPVTFPRVTSYSKPGRLSASSSTASMPMCRICHFPQGEDPDTLISPCRCSGTMQFIHESCLMKWLDVSKSKKAAACELCNYQYNRHKKFRLRHWQLPTCSRLDKILHSIFLLCLIVMASCATITIYCFKQKLDKIGSLTWLREDRYIKKREHTDLTKSEIVTLTCGVLFFVAFFMAMYVEVKAKDTLYRLFSRFVHLNQTWHIDEYDKQRDNQHAPV